MIDQQERYYNILKLNKWFAISSIIFMVVWIIVFVDDYQRTWKKYQKEFRILEIEKTRDDLTNLTTTLENDENYNSLLSELESAKKELTLKDETISELNVRIKSLNGDRYKINQEYQFAKAERDVAKYTFEATQHGHGDEAEAKKTLVYFTELTENLVLDKEEIEKIIEDENEKLKTIRREKKKISDALGSLELKKNLMNRKLAKVDPDAMSFSNKVANIVRDLPVLDFIDPYYEVKQVVVNDLDEDLVFMGMPKVDRCMICHLGIDKKGYEDAPQPYTTHPRLDVFVGSSSSHKMSEYGCTVCHGGRGRGTDFISATHSPNNEDVAHRWEDDYNWEPLHHWDNPMFPMKYVEASCYKCHSGTMPVRGAPTLSLGLAIIEKGGCFGCHQIERWEDTPKPGPGLRRIASKTTKEFAYKWIEAPREFRNDTWMPHFFNQLNTNDEKSIRRSNQEIHAIIHYLFEKSESFSFKTSRKNGDSENGRLLVKGLGCMGCHQIGSVDNGFPTFNKMRRQQGPNLQNLGSKTTQQWIFTWLKNPQQYHPETKMPDLRLSDQEAADISAFLISQNDENFESRQIPTLDESEINKIVASFLEQTMRKEEVDTKLASMDLNNKLSFSGEKLIRHYGCFSCHDIGGFEKSKPIGTPLTFEGSKLITKLDFGFMHNEIPHTKWDWFNLKLDNPRIYDMIPMEDGEFSMKIKRPLEKARMPHFGLDEHELDAIVTVLMGLVKDEIPVTKLPSHTTKNLIVDEGERLIQTYNCKGCHIIDNDGGAITASVADWLEEVASPDHAEDGSLVQSFSPPLLNTEGRKVQPEWLFNFLKKPTMIRPNTQVRMPTFTMINDNDWNRIIKYFQYKDDQLLAYENPHFINKNSDSYKAGDVIQELGACENCHFYGRKKPKQAALTWAPNLVLTKDRLRIDWLHEWFADPQKVMPGTKMPAPYIPTDVPKDDIKNDWGQAVASLDGDSTKLYQALIDYLWGIDGVDDVSKIVKLHLKNEGYGFIIEEEDEW